MKKHRVKIAAFLLLFVFVSGFALNLHAQEFTYNERNISDMADEDNLETDIADNSEEITNEEPIMNEKESSNNIEDFENEQPVKEETKTVMSKEPQTLLNRSKKGEGSVSIIFKNLKENEHRRYQLYGVKDNGTTAVEIAQLEGVKVYSWGERQTDENGIVQFEHLSIDSEEWYLVKDMDSGEIMHISSLPYLLDYEPADTYLGSYEKEGDSVLYYDLIFENQNGETWLSIPAKIPNEQDRVCIVTSPAKAATYASVEDGGWLKLYSKVKPRSRATVLARICKVKKNSSGRGEGHSIFKTTGDLYMACCEHEKRYPDYGSNGESFTESYYDGKNASKIRKTLYYGYGGYDHGEAYYKHHHAAPENYFIATVLLCSHYHGHQNPFSDWIVYKNLKEFVEGQPDPNKVNLAASSISFSKKKGQMHIGYVDPYEQISEGGYKDWYWSDEIVAKSDGTKKMTLTVPAGVMVFEKKTGKLLEAQSSAQKLTVKPGDTFKFGHEKTDESIEMSLHLLSEGGITTYRAIYANTKVEGHQDMLRAYYETETKKEATMTLFLEGNQPLYDVFSDTDQIKQSVCLKKVNENNQPLKDAVLTVTCENGETRTVRTDDNGKAIVDFSFLIESSEYRYLKNLDELSSKQIEDFLENPLHCRTLDDAKRKAQEELGKLKDAYQCHYAIKEIEAPKGYLASKEAIDVSVIGNGGQSEEIVIVNEAFPDILYTSETVSFYQEIKVIKENAFFETENNAADDPKYLNGAVFEVKNLKINGNAQLMEIIYNEEDEIKNIKNEDGSAIVDPHQKIEMISRKKGGIARAGFVYSITTTGLYAYPQKDWNSYSKVQQEKLEQAGVFHTKEEAKEEALKEANILMKEVSCTYSLREVKAPISLNGEPFEITFPDELTHTITNADSKIISVDEGLRLFTTRFQKG